MHEPEHFGDVSRLTIDGKEIVIIGTAHISQKSVETVHETIESEKPDTVCVELDEQRFTALREETNWEDLDLKQIIKDKQVTFLVARLALMAFQKRMSLYTGVKPGAEMLAAVEVAEANDMRIVLADRNIRTTLLRAWRKTPLFKRMGVAGLLLAGLFERTEVSEEDLEELREGQNIAAVLDELGEALPSVKKVLVDERDVFMAHKIRNAPGQKIVVVIGAAHKAGIIRHLQAGVEAADVELITDVPPRSTFSKMIPWIIPAVVIAIFTLGFIYGDPEQLKTAALAWILANGVLAAVGCIAAFGHPLTVITGFVAAPLTSLNPTIGAGMVTAFVQTYFVPPTVRDLEEIGNDLAEYSGWWKNRLARILLVFMFSNIGSMIGTAVSFGWLQKLF